MCCIYSCSVAKARFESNARDAIMWSLHSDEKRERDVLILSTGFKHDTALSCIFCLQLRVREHPVHGPYVADLSA